MIRPAIQKALPVLAFILIAVANHAQSETVPGKSKPVFPSETKAKKPYKVLTSGKKITIKSTNNIKNLLVWSARGNRVVEQKNLLKQEYAFTISIPENIFFILIEMENGQRFTEKIGI